MDKIQYPREFLNRDYDITPYPVLTNNRKNTIELLSIVNERLNNKFGQQNGFCIAVAGSYGRLEASKLSDFDLFVVYGGETDSKNIEDFRKTALNEARELSINAPNPQGVFVKPSHLDTLILNIGSKDDPISHLSQRMLLLMESQPLYNKAFFQDSIFKLLERYCEYVKLDPNKQFVLLLNEVIKYFRTICVNYQFGFWREAEKWPIRNIKLRHSRIAMYGGILLLLLNASKYGKDKYEYLKQNILLTPLEKICHVYIDNKESPAEFMSCYERFLSMMSDSKVRESLIGLEYKARYESPQYRALKENSYPLCSELTRFVLARQTSWPNSIFEYLIF